MNVSDTVDSPHSTSGLTNALPSASLIEHDSVSDTCLCLCVGHVFLRAVCLCGHMW